jgi:putative peptidoglycan lipid II flippase
VPRREQPGDVRGYVDTGPGTAARRDRGGDRTENYQNPPAWNGDRDPGGRGRREPDGPTEVHRQPASWRDRGMPAEPPPGGRPQRPATAPGPARPAPAPAPSDGAGGGERAWWDDAFRPAPPTRGRLQPPRQPAQAPPPPRQPRLLPPGPIVPDPPAPSAPHGPPVPPGRPARPRSAPGGGYGVPPGELTQPIPIYQPQGAYIPADTYEAEDLYEDDLYDEAYAPERPYRRERAPERVPEGAGLTRSTGSMAIGTLISRVTGFLRTFVFAIALGDAALANAYNNANTIPNAVYDVMIGGVLTSVVVPLLVKAAREHRDGGEAYNQRMFTLTVFALGAVTVVATIAAGLLVALYAGAVPGTEHSVMVVFAYFFIPQIFFYGMSSLIGAILNTRNSFSAPMWTPIINNVIVIVVGLLFIVSLGVHRDVGNVSSGGILLLGVGTTLGIIVQTVTLIPSLRRVGFRWRPRFDFRRVELAEIGRMAIWMLGYVVSTQIGFIVTTRVANTASVHVQSAGVTAYNYSYALFLMPYAIIGVSVTTALLPRMSRHAAEGRFGLVREDFSYSVRLSSVILAPAALLLAVLGTPICELLFSYGHMTVPDARYIGEAFAAFSLGLLPFVIFQLLLRVFYAMHDSRTPAIIGFWTMLATVAGNYLVLAMLPAQEVVIGMAFVYGLTSIFSAAIAWRLLARRFGGLDGSKVTRSLVRMHVAAVPALVFAFVVSVVVGGVFHPGPVYGFITVLVGGGGALLLYFITAKALHLDELVQVMRMVTGRFGGRPPQGTAR